MGMGVRVPDGYSDERGEIGEADGRGCEVVWLC